MAELAEKITPEGGLRVVVIGATGNVGTSVVEALRTAPEVRSILGVARRRPEWSPRGVDWATADVSGDSLDPLVRGADVVVHLAWLFQPTRDPVVTWAVNVMGTLRVLDSVARQQVPAVVVGSSVGAYSPGPKDAEVDERWPTDGWPEAAYTREKAYVERALDGFEREHPETRVVRMRPGFMFKEAAASGQRRLFLGPFLPARATIALLRLAVPALSGLRFQVLHTDDAAVAFREAVVRQARGPYNLAADPVIDADQLRRELGGLPVPLPRRLADLGAGAAWRARLVPSTPGLLEALLHLPIMSTARARRQLGWEPRTSSLHAIAEAVAGLRAGSGMATAPLEPWRSAWPRALTTGVGGLP